MTEIEVVEMFSNEDRALVYAEGVRWPAGVHCPICGASAERISTRHAVWVCRRRHQFSVRHRSLMDNSKLPVGKWLIAMWALATNPAISSYRLRKMTGMSQKGAWSLLRRLRSLGSCAEMDEFLTKCFASKRRTV
jgi:hypothetical protein